MKPVLFLRIASILTFFHAVLHTIGGVFGEAEPGLQQATMATMKANQFPLMGSMRSYWDFYFGLGLAVSVFLLIEAIVFWQLGELARTEAPRLRPLLVTFLLGYLGLAVNSTMYIFAPPAVIEVLIALCLGWAILKSRTAASIGPVLPK